MKLPFACGLLALCGCISDAPPPARAGDPPAKPYDAPEFEGITDWVNSKPLKMADLKGKVVIVHFWTNGCINCIHNYPHYQAWAKRASENDKLVQIGVHTPEFEGEKNIERLKEQMEKYKLTFIAAVDNDSKTWKAWKNEYWPSIYLVDVNGQVRKHHAGELGEDGYKTMTETIDDLLKEKPKDH